MWSLPDIQRMNERAAAQSRQVKREAARKRKPQCSHYGCEQRAAKSFLYYDIFSNQPKGVVHVCDRHHNGLQPDDDELFFCEGCQRVMVDHYAWERYQVVIGDTVLCLKCAAKQYFSDPKNWIDPKLVKSVVVEPYDPRKNGTNTPLFSPRTGKLNVARSPHVLGVKQPLPRGIAFVENAEFDRMEGHQISGRSLLGVIRELNQPFAPVLDAGWQFAVSIGIYVRSGAGAQLKEAA